MSGSTERQDAVAAVPWPARYWWLKRFALAGMLLILVVACLRVWWGVVAERRFDAAIAAIVARGEPIYPEDFVQQPVPDEDNAAILYLQASEALIGPSGNFTFVDVINNPEIVGERLEDVRKIIEAERRAIDIVRQARSRPAVYWKTRHPSVANARQPSLIPFVDLARLLAVAAIYHHEIGNERAAVELLNDVIRLGRAVGEAIPSLLSTLMEVVIDGVAAGACEYMAPGISVVAGPLDKTKGSYEASRDEIGALINSLLDERRMREQWEIGVCGERAFELDAVRSVLAGQSIFLNKRTGNFPTLDRLRVGVDVFLNAPAYQLDAIRLLENITRLSALSSEPNLPAAQSLIHDMPIFDTLLDRQTRYISMTIMPYFGGTWDRLVADWTQGALVGVMLAIRLYEIDHGRRPAALHELVPTYLPHVPVDLMAADGRKIAYVRTGDNPRVYSVGRNARDDGGKLVKSTRATRRSDQSLPDDIIVYLNGKPGKSAASRPSAAQRKEDGDDVQRQPRDP